MSNNRTDAHIYSAKQNGNAQSGQGKWVQTPQERSVEKLLPSKAPLTDAEAKQKFERLTELLESDESKAQNLRVAKELIHLRQEKLALDTLIFSEEKNIERFRLVAGQQALIAPPVSSMGLAQPSLALSVTTASGTSRSSATGFP